MPKRRCLGFYFENHNFIHPLIPKVVKRLALKDFVQKQALHQEPSDHLLGQVLGDCHDRPKDRPLGSAGNEQEEIQN